MAERLIKTAPAPNRLAFIDLEASGLGAKSWPVEVGWTFEEGEPSSMLVHPYETWSDDAWDPRAEQLHGLDRARLGSEGAPAREVCVALNEALAGADVYSDAPDWDGFWLYRLFSAGRIRQAFALHDFARLMRPLVAGGDRDELVARAGRLAPRRHRAGADARNLQTLYRLAVETCGPRLTR